MNIHPVYEFFWKRFRKKRIAKFFALLGVNEKMTILDAGGTEYFWELASGMNLPVPRITIFNLGERPAGLAAKYSYVKGDGRQMPFGNGEFDLVFSNSVIEHIPGRTDRERFAGEIRRVGRGYFVQTPDIRFPVEPHLIMPFIHWLPESLMVRMIPGFTVRGWMGGVTDQEALELKSVRLLCVREMASYFPDAEIIAERFIGVPKSIIALRRIC